MRVIAHKITVLQPDPSADASTPAPGTGRRPKQMRPAFGLGDLVEQLAKPVARKIDEVTADLGTPTRLNGCGACSKRRRFLNVLVPAVRSWRIWAGSFGRWGLAWRAVYGCRKQAARKA